MDIDNLTLKQIREISALCSSGSSKSHSFVVGQKVLIRCVTYHQIGRIEAVTDSDIVLSSASWVASSGRWHECLEHGTLDEVEPYPAGIPCVVSRSAIVDWCQWKHALPTAAK